MLRWIVGYPSATLLALLYLLGSGSLLDLPPFGEGAPVLLLLAVVGFGARYIDTRSHFATSSPMWAWIMLASWSMVTLLWSTGFPYGSQKVFSLWLSAIAPAVVFSCHLASENWTRAFFSALRVLGMIVCTLGVIYFLAVSQGPAGRASFFGGHPLAYGQAAMLTTIAGLAPIASVSPMRSLSRQPSVDQLRVGAATAGVIGVVLSNSKGPLLSLAVAGLIVVVGRGPGLGFSQRAKRHFAAILVTALVGLFMLGPAETIGTRLLPSFYIGDDAASRTTSITSRTRLWSLAVEDFADHPILGIGAGSFNQHRFFTGFYWVGGDEHAVLYPHSISHEIAAELGAIGLLLFAIFLAQTLRLVLQRQTTTLGISGQLITAAGLAQSMVSGDISDTKVLLLGIAALHAQSYLSPTRRGQSQARQKEDHEHAENERRRGTSERVREETSSPARNA